MTPRYLLKSFLPALLLVLCVCGPLTARTITLTAEDCDQIAVLSAKAPRLSWACCQLAPGVSDTAHQLQMYQDMALLMRFPMERIPKDQRITKAELTLKANHVDNNPHLHMRRLLAEWGPGVCHLYRTTQPRKIEWKEAGARGVTTDRANRESAVFNIPSAGEYTKDVTEDIELWYTGAVANRGWIFTLDSGFSLSLPSPYSPATASGKEWKLRITYEPK